MSQEPARQRFALRRRDHRRGARPDRAPMWIVIAGNPIGGFSLYGPMESGKEAMECGKVIGHMHGGDGSEDGGPEKGDPWYPFELVDAELAGELCYGAYGRGQPLRWEVKETTPPNQEVPETHSGVAVVFSGLRGLNDGWIFFGGFSDIKAAYKFAAERGMEAIPLLKPFDDDDPKSGDTNV
jgi:hypothetical protein